MSTSASVADAVSHALPAVGSAGPTDLASQWSELRGDLEAVSREAYRARLEGLSLAEAVVDPRFPFLCQMHQDLRDAMFVEIPKELQPWVEDLQTSSDTATRLGNTLTHLARQPTAASQAEASDEELQVALSEVLLFEAVRLRLLAAVWETAEFERLGGEETDIDRIAWDEVQAMLSEPDVERPDVRPLQLMYAAASVSLARQAGDLASELRMTSPDLRARLAMQAKLRAALRELRLAEGVLLENALASMLGHDRVELRDLQELRPVALEGLSRQAMDQRVSRGRRALTRSPQSWPRRRRPALVDLLRAT